MGPPVVRKFLKNDCSAIFFRLFENLNCSRRQHVSNYLHWTNYLFQSHDIGNSVLNAKYWVFSITPLYSIKITNPTAATKNIWKETQSPPASPKNFGKKHKVHQPSLKIFVKKHRVHPPSQKTLAKKHKIHTPYQKTLAKKHKLHLPSQKTFAKKRKLCKVTKKYKVQMKITLRGQAYFLTLCTVLLRGVHR